MPSKGLWRRGWLPSLRAKGLWWTLSALVVGAVAAGLWLSSETAWNDFRHRAFLAGLELHNALRAQQPLPDGIVASQLDGDHATRADAGDFAGLPGAPRPAYVTQLSVGDGTPSVQAQSRLRLAVVSPDLRYSVADVAAQGGYAQTVALGNVTRLLASYCSEPVLYVQFDSAPWWRVEGSAVWGCSAAPRDYRLVAVLLVVLYLAAVVSQITNTIGQFSAFAQALWRRHRLGGPDTYDAEGPRELMDIVEAVNSYLESERQVLSQRALVLSGVSHDLGTPATRLKLRTALIGDAELRNKLEADIDQMTRMIDGVLTYTRSELNVEAPRKLSLATLVEAVVSDYQDLGRPVTLEHGPDTEITPSRSVFASGAEDRPVTVVQPHRILVTARPVSLQRALSNLIDNAIRYGRRAHVLVEADSEWATITVEDEGSAVEPADMMALTAPFSRGPNSQAIAGTGLGLTVVATIAAQHGGRLWFERNGGGLAAKLSILRH